MRTKPPHTRRVFMQQRRGRMTAWSPLEDQCSVALVISIENPNSLFAPH